MVKLRQIRSREAMVSDSKDRQAVVRAVGNNIRRRICDFTIVKLPKNHRREAVEKQLFNAAGKISGGEQLASIEQLYKLNLGPLSVVPDDPYRESTVFRKENIKNYPQCSNHFECALRSGEHYFPSGKFFKLTSVLEPFRMRFEIGEPVALNLVYYWVLP